MMQHSGEKEISVFIVIYLKRIRYLIILNHHVILYSIINI